jgi:CRP-like cAMP-binding protein
VADAGRQGFVAGLDDRDRTDLLDLGSRRRYRTGAALFFEGDRSDFVVVLREGRVKVFCTTAEGRELVLALRGAGDLVGELAAIDGDPEPRAASVVALEPVLAQLIDAETFRDFVAGRPRVALGLLRSLTARLRVADRRQVEFGGYDTSRRLASVLVELAEEYGLASEEGISIDVPLSQEELAGMIGGSRESVARALARLRSKGLVQTRRRGITICDPARLRRFAI